MNDNDLERQLRTQAGPREEGYVPARLPTSPDDMMARRPSPLMRAAVLVPAVAAGVVAVAVAGALLRGGGNTHVGSGSPVSSPSPSEVANGACLPGQVSASAEDWGGAAGSRGTLITLGSLRRGGDCLLGEPFSVQIRAESGELLAAGTSPADSATGFQLGQSGGAAQVGVSWSNWCGDPVDGTVRIVLAFPGAGEVTVEPGGAGSPIPPCMGEGQKPSVSVTELQPAP